MYQLTREEISKLPHRKQVMFALFCAEQVTHLLNKDTKVSALKAIEVTKLWLEGKATLEECRAAAHAACAAAYAADAAAYAAAYAADADAAAYAARAAYAADAAAYAADAAAEDRDKLIKEQHNYYNALLNLDKYAEGLVS